MSTARTGNDLSAAIGMGFVIIFAIGLIYAIFTGWILLWVGTALSLGLSAYVLYLFYRLVVAVEEIAAKL